MDKQRNLGTRPSAAERPQESGAAAPAAAAQPFSNGLQAGGAPRVAACPMMRMDGIPGLRGRPRGQSGFSIDSTVAEHAPPWADCC